MKPADILLSKFFELGNEPLTPKQLETYCRIWWPIQPQFTLGLIVLLGNVAKEIRERIMIGDIEGENLYKEIFRWQAPAIIDEMGMGRDPYGLMHHDLFIEQVYATTKLTRNSLFSDFINTDTNMWLAMKISQAFESVVNGLCMMYVVETIAPDLFSAQEKIFLAAGAPIGKLRHSTLHKNLEQSHASEAEYFLPYLKKIFTNKELDVIIGSYAVDWKNFLDEVFEKVSQ